MTVSLAHNGRDVFIILERVPTGEHSATFTESRVTVTRKTARQLQLDLAAMFREIAAEVGPRNILGKTCKGILEDGTVCGAKVGDRSEDSLCIKHKKTRWLSQAEREAQDESA